MSEAAVAQTSQTNEPSSKPTNEASSKPTNEAPSQPSNEAPSKPTNEASSQPTSSRGTEGACFRSNMTANSFANVSHVRTVKVTNVALKTDKTEIKEFFSFSGDIQHVEMQQESDTTQIAYVTYKESQGAETALCLTGATISNLSVTITPVENYQLPPDAAPLDSDKSPPSNAHKAEDVVTTMLARGFVLGKDAVNKAKDFDEQHQLSSKASDRVNSIDNKIGFSEKLSIGTAAVNVKAREVDQKYQVSEKTKHAYQVAEEKATTAGTAIMNNRYVMTGATWISNAYSAVAKAAEDVSTKTKEKVEKERQERLAAMSPKSREKAVKAENDKAAEEAKAKDEAKKDDDDKSPKNKETPKKADEKENANKEKNVPDGSPKLSNSGDSKAADK